MSDVAMIKRINIMLKDNLFKTALPLLQDQATVHSCRFTVVRERMNYATVNRKLLFKHTDTCIPLINYEDLSGFAYINK